MKKIGLLLVVVFFIGMLSNIQAQRAIKNGFSINAVIGLSSKGFGLDNMESMNSDVQVKMLYGLQLGNRWYFNPTEQYGIGLMVNWIDFAVGAKSTTINNFDYGIAAIDLTFLEVGPIGTYAISEDMAIDGYYNLRPTVFSYAIVDEDEDSYVSAGAGFSHTIGAAFRYNKLNIGIEYVFGGIEVSQEESAGINIPNNEKMSVNNFRIVFGFKF
ncbi:MAG: hypothetical protein R6V23_08860 [Bacteroidales bacterium]